MIYPSIDSIISQMQPEYMAPGYLVYTRLLKGCPQSGRIAIGSNFALIVQIRVEVVIQIRMGSSATRPQKGMRTRDNLFAIGCTRTFSACLLIAIAWNLRKYMQNNIILFIHPSLDACVKPTLILRKSCSHRVNHRYRSSRLWSQLGVATISAILLPSYWIRNYGVMFLRSKTAIYACISCLVITHQIFLIGAWPIVQEDM